MRQHSYRWAPHDYGTSWADLAWSDISPCQMYLTSRPQRVQPFVFSTRSHGPSRLGNLQVADGGLRHLQRKWSLYFGLSPCGSAVIEAMGVSTVAAKPVWSWARKNVKNIFIDFHVFRFKLVKVMSCESQTGVWLMSFGTAQPPSLSFFGTQGSSWKSKADQVGPHHTPQFQDARFSCLNAALFFACLRQPLYWHRKKIQIHRAPNGASNRVFLLNRFFLLFHKEKAQFIPSFFALEKLAFWNFLMQCPSRVLLISSCAMRALFCLSSCAISCFFLQFFVHQIVP